MTTNPFRPSDEEMAAYLDGEHGPPSQAALDVIQAELEWAARREASTEEGDEQ